MKRIERVLGFTAGVEAATGLALVALPSFVARLLLGEELAGTGAVVARCFGVTLLSLALAVWPRVGAATRQPARAMLFYNAALALYLAWLGTAGHLGGPLLWPAAVLHGVVALLLAASLRATRAPIVPH